MTARIDHEQEALDAAAAGKYDIAQYHATMLVAERLAPTTHNVTTDVAALRTMMGRGSEVVSDSRWTVVGLAPDMGRD